MDGFIKLHSGCVINTDMILRISNVDKKHFVELVDGTRLNLYEWERENLEYYLGAENIHGWHAPEVAAPDPKEMDWTNPWAKDSAGNQIPFRKLDNT